tara:strand:+ start:2577 stop:3137 length:561 start_codon:yes stop_codon:yes gene_type:complete
MFMRQFLALLMVAMLALSVSGAGEAGVNDSTSTEGTGIASLSHADMVIENTEFEISVTLDEGNNISKIEWITQVCINTGICWPPQKTLLVDSGDGLTFTGSVLIDDYATYANWRFDITRSDESTETVPESGFGWKVWSDCWFDNGTWGGPSTDCQEENDDSSLPGFTIITAMAGIGIAVLSRKNDD